MGNSCNSNCGQCVISVNDQAVDHTGKIGMEMIIVNIQTGFGEI